MYGGTAYEIIGISTFVITLIWIARSWRIDRAKANPLISMFLVGLFFGFSWEPQGTGPIWSYQGFNLYVYAGIPLVIILNWSWVMILCHLISRQIVRVFESVKSIGEHWIVDKASLFFSAAIIASIVEPIFVSMGRWQYHFLGDKAVLTFPLLNVRFHLAVIVGWGMLTTINLTLSKRAESLATRFMSAFRLSHFVALVGSSSLLGLFSGWLSWQLVILLATLIENVEPRIFFTRDHIIVLDWITSAQLVTILISAAASAMYILRLKRAGMFVKNTNSVRKEVSN